MSHTAEYFLEVVLFRYYETPNAVKPERAHTLSTPISELFPDSKERADSVKALRLDSARRLGIDEAKLPTFEARRYSTLGDIVIELKNIE
jgi:hypothetical protein